MQIITEDTEKAAPRYNETETRFHVIDPIVRNLGYPDQDDVYLNLEEKLEYPYVHIGHRSKKDLPLGFPDYRAGLKGARGSFVIEAKAGDVSITSRHVEQAHSYAAHAQVGANYFVLCNGSAVKVYETLSGPEAKPIADIPLGELNDRFHELENILSPASLKKNCQVEYDKRMRLAEGLGSSAEIRSGRYVVSNYEYRIVMNGQDCTDLFRRSVPQLAQLDQNLELMTKAFELRITGGSAERDADGRIGAHLQFGGITIPNYQAMQIMGVTEASFATADEFISNDPQSPSIFESLKDFSVSKGTLMPDLFGEASELVGDLTGDMFIKAAMCHDRGKIFGDYIALADQRISLPDSLPVTVELDIVGTFELRLNN